MKKTLTPKRSIRSNSSQETRRHGAQAAPARATLEFIRQFARCYQAAPAGMPASMPGYSLN